MNEKFKGGIVPLAVVSLFIFVAILTSFSLLRDRSSNNSSLTGAVINSQVASVPPAPTMHPGAGWAGPTPTPLPNGDGPAPIARFDAVPFQTLQSETGIGVVAFHINDIDRVEFAVEGGPWVAVKEMTLNPTTGIVEYWAKLATSDFSVDGSKEVRAVVHSKQGQSIVLQGNNLKMDADGIHSLYVNTNGRGTLTSNIRWADSVNGNDTTGNGTETNPFKTIVAAAADLTVDHGSSGGGSVYLKPGDYFWGLTTTERLPKINTDNNRWLTVQAAPGVDKNRVTISGSSSSGLDTKLVHLQNVRVNNTKIRTTGRVNAIWANNIIFMGGGPDNPKTLEYPLTPTEYSDGIFVTDSEFGYMKRATGSYALGRHLKVHHIWGDMFRGPRLLLDVTGSYLFDANPDIPGFSVGGLAPDVHRDLLQDIGPSKNVIIYGMKATDHISGQDFFFTCGPTTYCENENIAVVNYIADSTSQIPGKYGVTTRHMFLLNVVHTKRFLLTNHKDKFPTWPNTRFDYLSIKNSVFGSFGVAASLTFGSNNSDNWADNNHFIGDPARPANSGYNTPRGTNYTTGGSLSTLFTKYTTWDAPDNDFHPSASSVLRGTVRPYPVARLVPVDLEGTPIPGDGKAAIGSLQARATDTTPLPEPEPDPTDPNGEVGTFPSDDEITSPHQGTGVLSYLATNLPYNGPSQFTGRAFYVDPVNGLDTNDGSATRPWKTIKEVISSGKIQSKDKNGTPINPGAPVQPGDTIYLRSGYHGHISLTSYFNDSMTAIVAAPGQTPRVDFININSGKNWKIQGLKVTRGTTGTCPGNTLVSVSGSATRGPASKIEFIGNNVSTVDDASSFTENDWKNVCNGISLGEGQEMLVKDNLILNVRRGIGGISNDSKIINNRIHNFSQIGMVVKGSRILIDRNQITNAIYPNHRHHMDGIQAYGKGGASGLGCFCNNVTVTNNLFYANVDGPNRAFQGPVQLHGFGLFDGPYKDWFIANNVINIGNHRNGITAEQATGFVIINNTVVGGEEIGSSGKLTTTWIKVLGPNTIRNNFVSSKVSSQSVNDHNILIERVTDLDKYFADWRNRNFRLKAGSLAINAGSDVLAPTTDITGAARDTTPDIGAYELPGGAGLPVPLEPGVTPEPPITAVPPTTPPGLVVGPGDFGVGATIVTTDNVRVRKTPSGDRLGNQTRGSTGTIAEGPVVANGFTWWNVKFDKSPGGWSVENFLKVTGQPTQILGPITSPTPITPLPTVTPPTVTIPPTSPVVTTPVPTTPPSTSGGTVSGSTLGNGLLAHFKFDDNTNDAVDSNSGSPVGELAYIDGKIGKAASFYGTNTGVNLGSKTLSALGIGNQFSISVWANTTGGTGAQTIFGKGGTNTSAENASIEFELIGEGSKARLRVSNGVDFVAASGNGLSPGVWYHLVGTYGGTIGKVEMYVNGTKTGENTNVSVTAPNDSVAVAGVAIGKDGKKSGDNFRGSLDDLRVYNRVLTPSEIKDLYAGAVAAAEPETTSGSSYFANVLNSIGNALIRIFGLKAN